MRGDLSKLLEPLAIDDDDGGISAINALLDSFRKDAGSVAKNMHPAVRLSRYFNENPPESYLHLIVQAPISGTNCLPSTDQPGTNHFCKWRSSARFLDPTATTINYISAARESHSNQRDIEGGRRR